MKWLTAIRKFLGAITDVLIKGRQAGLYDEKNGPGGPVK